MAAASGGNIEVLSSDEVMAEGDKQEVLLGNVQGYVRKKLGPSRAQSPQRSASPNKAPVLDEFEVLFEEQRIEVAKNNIPLYNTLHPDTRKLFTAPLKDEPILT